MKFEPKSKRKLVTRDIKKSVRFSKNEMTRIEEKCKKSNMKISEYIRKKSLNIDVDNETHLFYIESFLREINRIGNNLNQIARKVNQNFYDDDHKIELLSEIKEIDIQFREVLKDMK